MLCKKHGVLLACCLHATASWPALLQSNVKLPVTTQQPTQNIAHPPITLLCLPSIGMMPWQSQCHPFMLATSTAIALEVLNCKAHFRRGTGQQLLFCLVLSRNKTALLLCTQLVNSKGTFQAPAAPALPLLAGVHLCLTRLLYHRRGL